MPSIEPLAPLSPAIEVSARLARGFEARLTGRFEAACEVYRETLQLLEGGNAGLDTTFADSMRAAMPSIIGFLESVLGLPTTAHWATEVARFPLYQGSTLAIRMLDKLWQGEVAGADRLGRQRELWRLEQPRQQASDVLTVLWTLQAHAASDDLTHTRHNLEAIERTASKLRTWQPIADWARGEYERIRGDYGAALLALDSALQSMEAGRHQIWPLAAAARLRVLCEQDRFAEAYADGERYFALARENQLGYLANYMRMPLAFAAAKLGHAQVAWDHVHAVIDSFDKLGARGLNPGLAYEAAARVAACLGEQDELERYAALCKERFLLHPNPALGSKYQRLVRSVRRAASATYDTLALDQIGPSLARSQIESMLQACSTRQERLDTVLQLLVDNSGAEGGFLYGVVDGVVSLCAHTGDPEPPREIAVIAARCLEHQLSGGDEDTAAEDVDTSSGQWTSTVGRCYRPLLLNHQGGEGFVISGLAVLAFECAYPPRPASETAIQVSRAIVDSGDLAPHVVAIG